MLVRCWEALAALRNLVLSLGSPLEATMADLMNYLRERMRSVVPCYSSCGRLEDFVLSI